MTSHLMQDHTYLAREDGLEIPKAVDPINDPNGPVVVVVPCRVCGRPESNHPKPEKPKKVAEKKTAEKKSAKKVAAKK